MSAVDVVVAGGGPAGLAAAIACRRRGLEVVVLERGRPPIDRPCGEGLMPEGVAVLARLGVELDGSVGCRFQGIEWVDGEVRAAGRFAQGPGRGVRRTALHRLLAERAAAEGVELRWGSTVRGLRSDGLDTDHGPCPARWVVGADGRASRVRRWAGLDGAQRRRRRVGLRRHLAIAPWSEMVEVHWGPGVEAYVTPVAPDMVGVAVMAADACGGFDAILARLPALADRLHGATVASRDAGAGPFGRPAAAVHRGRVLLVGDAAGSLDPITGEGLGLAFRQAELLAAALQGGRPQAYAAGCRTLRRSPELLNRLVLLLVERPRLRRRVLRALAADEALFGRLLALRGGAGAVVRKGLVPLAWRLARAAA